MPKYITPSRFIAAAALLIAMAVSLTQLHGSDATDEGNAGIAPALPSRVLVRAEGQIAARRDADIVVSAEAMGALVMTLPADQMEVAAGEVVARLNAEELTAQLAEARARLSRARTQQVFAARELGSERQLWTKGATAQATLTERERDAALTTAELSVADAVVSRLVAATAKTVIRAPIAGTVIARLVQTGEVIGAGAPVVRIVDLSALRVTAEVDETDAASIVAGASVKITAEGLTDRSWHGTVSDVPAAVTRRTLKSQDAARPTDTRVLAVEIMLTEATPLKLGQRVEVEIDCDSVR